MKRGCIVALLCAALGGCGESHVAKIVELDACTGLRAQGSLALLLLPGEQPRLEFSGPANVVDAIEIIQMSGAITLTNSAPEHLEVRMSCPNLRSVALLGSVQAVHQQDNAVLEFQKVAVYGDSRFEAKHIASDHIDIRSGGNASIAIDQLMSESVQFFLSGDSQASVAGATAILTAELGGAAALAAAGLQAQTVKLKARGASHAAVFATAHLVAELQDSSKLAYAGSPDLEVTRADQATIQQN